MGFNLMNALSSGTQAFLMTGNPVAAAGAGAFGGFGGRGATGASAVGNLGNIAQNGWQSAILGAQDLMNLQNATYQLALQNQSNQFDQMTSEKSELMRQSNVLREVAMQQRKADDQITKKFIESITG